MDWENYENFDWDAITLDADAEGQGGSPLLEAGEYDYTVTGYERKQYAGGPKIPPCPELDITVYVDGAQITERLFLTKSMQWKLAQFMVSCGLKKHGEEARVDFSRLVGATGRCEVGVHSWTGNDGAERKSNQIKRWLYPVAKPAAPTSWENTAW